MISAEDEIKKQLANGNDAEARWELCRELETIIQQSDAGEIGIGAFTDELATILYKGTDYLKLFKG